MKTTIYINTGIPGIRYLDGKSELRVRILNRRGENQPKAGKTNEERKSQPPVRDLETFKYRDTGVKVWK